MENKKISIEIDTESTSDREIYAVLKNFLVEHFQNWNLHLKGNEEIQDESRRKENGRREKEQREQKKQEKRDKQSGLQ